MENTNGQAPRKGDRERNKKDVSRREFFGALGVSAAGLILGSCAKDRGPLSPSAGAENTVRSAVPMGRETFHPQAMSRVATADVTSYDRDMLRQNMESLFNAIGGVTDIAGGRTVGLKVNLTGGSWNANTNPPAVELFWTHPEVVRAAGELLKDAGASKMYIVEAIYDWKSYNGYGFRDVANYLGATLIDLNATDPYTEHIERPVGDGWLIYENFTQNAILNDIDCMVSFPKAKQHVGAGVTHSMKNLVGSVPLGIYGPGQSSRQLFHQHREIDGNTSSNLRRIVIDLNQATKIHLAVTDAIKTMMGGEGPWQRKWTAAAFNKLIVSKDIVAADSIATQVIGFDPMVADDTGVFEDGINYLRLAQEKGLGTYDLAQIEVVDATVKSGIH